MTRMVAHPPSGQAHIHTCNRNGEKRVQLKQILRAKKSWAQLLRSFFTWKKIEVTGTDRASKPCEPIHQHCWKRERILPPENKTNQNKTKQNQQEATGLAVLVPVWF